MKYKDIKEFEKKWGIIHAGTVIDKKFKTYESALEWGSWNYESKHSPATNWRVIRRWKDTDPLGKIIVIEVKPSVIRRNSKYKYHIDCPVCEQALIITSGAIQKALDQAEQRGAREYRNKANKRARRRYKEKGVCVVCGQPKVTNTLCQKHREMQAEKQRKYLANRQND